MQHKIFPRWTFWSMFSKLFGPNSIPLRVKHVRRGTTGLRTFVWTLSLLQKNAKKWLKTPPQDGGLGWGWFDRPKKLFRHPIFHLGEKNKIWTTLFWQHLVTLISIISNIVILTHKAMFFCKNAHLQRYVLRSIFTLRTWLTPRWKEFGPRNVGKIF